MLMACSFSVPLWLRLGEVIISICMPRRAEKRTSRCDSLQHPSQEERVILLNLILSLIFRQFSLYLKGSTDSSSSTQLFALCFISCLGSAQCWLLCTTRFGPITPFISIFISPLCKVKKNTLSLFSFSRSHTHAYYTTPCCRPQIGRASWRERG